MIDGKLTNNQIIVLILVRVGTIQELFTLPWVNNALDHLERAGLIHLRPYTLTTNGKKLAKYLEQQACWQTTFVPGPPDGC